MAIMANAIEKAGVFPEEIWSSGELYLVRKIRNAGFKIKFIEMFIRQ